MSAVKHDFPRSGLFADGPKFDPGIDCSVDPQTGETGLVSMTKQSFAEECDINFIMRRYETTGTIDHVNRRSPEYGDFSLVVDFQQAMDTVLEAEAMFSDLPARVRDRFGNDPANLLAFLSDASNLDEAIKLGLVQPPAEEAKPQKVEVVNPPQQKPAKPASGDSGTEST